MPPCQIRRHGNQKAGKPPTSPYSTRASAFQPPHKEPVASPHIKTGRIPDGLLHILLLLLTFRINKDKMDRHACPYRLSFLIAEAMQVLLQKHPPARLPPAMHQAPVHFSPYFRYLPTSGKSSHRNPPSISFTHSRRILLQRQKFFCRIYASQANTQKATDTEKCACGFNHFHKPGSGKPRFFLS